MRDHVNVVEFLAPELVDPEKQPDERADVFAAGAVLWELLTSRELTLESTVVQGHRSRPRLPSVSLSVPKGTQIPPEVAQAINAALELDPTKRLATRSALRSALTQGVEVATYEKVIDFIDALLHRESTLFRLTLNPGPRLSDKLRSERPKPPQLERDVRLAKRARSAQPPPKPSLTPDLVPAFAPEVHRDPPDIVPPFSPDVNRVSHDIAAALAQVVRPAEPAASTAGSGQARDFVPPPTSVGRQLFQLSLPTLVIGLVVTVTISVLTTIMIQRSISKNPPAPAVSVAVTARPPLSTVPIATPAPTPSVEETVTASPTSTAASSETPSAAEASTILKPLAQPPDKSTGTDNPAVPKNVGRKRRLQYVPHGL
jgi:hypothetical protein